LVLYDPHAEQIAVAIGQLGVWQTVAIVKSIALILVIASLAVPLSARAQSDDQAYCAQLSDLYRRYVQNAPGRRGDVEASVALEDCSKGKTAAAIPVLEKKLRAANITPPGGGEFKP
jgi:hypothetical protein